MPKFQCSWLFQWPVTPPECKLRKFSSCRDSFLLCCPLQAGLDIPGLALCSWQGCCDQEACWQTDVHSPAGIASDIGSTLLRQRQAVRVTPWFYYISVCHHSPKVRWNLRWCLMKVKMVNQGLPTFDLDWGLAGVFWLTLLSLKVQHRRS